VGERRGHGDVRAAFSYSYAGPDRHIYAGSVRHSGANFYTDNACA